MKKIAITGLSGVIGSRLSKSLPEGFKIYNLYHTHKEPIKGVMPKHIELLKPESIDACLNEISPEIIVHMASATHIDRCEEDRKYGEKGDVWKVNVNATNTIATYCKKNKTQLIFLSTECVFDGEELSYDEKSVKNPKNWYGVTKSKAEDIIFAACPTASIIRAVIAYNEQDREKTLFGKILQGFKNGKQFKAVTDQIITPTYTDDIVKAIKLLIQKPKSGIFHISPEDKTTAYDFALKIAEKFGFDQSLIVETTLNEYFGAERAQLRLKNSCLDGKWTQSQLKFTPLNITQVLDKINL
ncbi:MAG: SDR family oxidoreductase [Candidatus Daviesbacteria bacterium]|nr:SDR family oxidoreductase [Candidatus Daviesbacteria bacterium]